MPPAMLSSGPNRFALKQNAEINVTPFVDVMLVLLIVMMVAAPMATVSIGLDQTPPRPIAGNPKYPTSISVAEGGAIFVAGEYLPLRRTDTAHLTADVAAALGGSHPTDRLVSVRADRKVRYREFMAVVSALKAGGYTHIALVNEAV